MVTQGPVAPSGWVLSGRANFGASESHYAPVTGGCQREFTPHLVRPLVVPPNIQANDRIRRKAFHHRHLQPHVARRADANRPRRLLSQDAPRASDLDVRRVGEERAGDRVRPVSRGVLRVSGGCVLLAERGTLLQEQGGCHPQNSALRDLNTRNCHRRSLPLPDDLRARSTQQTGTCRRPLHRGSGHRSHRARRREPQAASGIACVSDSGPWPASRPCRPGRTRARSCARRAPAAPARRSGAPSRAAGAPAGRGSRR